MISDTRERPPWPYDEDLAAALPGSNANHSLSAPHAHVARAGATPEAQIFILRSAVDPSDQRLLERGAPTATNA